MDAIIYMSISSIIRDLFPKNNNCACFLLTNKKGHAFLGQLCGGLMVWTCPSDDAFHNLGKRHCNGKFS